MFEELKTALEKAETKGDVAVVLGAGTVGFAVDGLAFAHGAFSGGTVSALSATGALAIKKGWDARRDLKRSEKAAAKALEKVQGARPRAETLERFFENEGYEEGVRVLRVHLAWHKQDVINDEQLGQAIEATRNDFLGWVKTPSDRAPTPPDVPVQRAG